MPFQKLTVKYLDRASFSYRLRPETLIKKIFQHRWFKMEEDFNEEELVFSIPFVNTLQM